MAVEFIVRCSTREEAEAWLDQVFGGTEPKPTKAKTKRETEPPAEPKPKKEKKPKEEPEIDAADLQIRIRTAAATILALQDERRLIVPQILGEFGAERLSEVEVEKLPELLAVMEAKAKEVTE